MRSLLLAFLLAAASLHDATAQIAEERLTLALDTLAQIAQDGDASLMAHMACLDHGAGVEGGRIAPCVYQGDPRMEHTAGAFVDAIYEALPPDGAWILDAVTTRTVEGRGLTEVQVKVRRDDEPVGQPVFLFADHASRPLLVQVNRGPSMMLADAPPPEEPSVLDLPILRAPDLSVQLPARAAFLQAAARGALPHQDAAALIACRRDTDEEFVPAPCSASPVIEDRAERVDQVLAEIAFLFGDATIRPSMEAIVAPYEMEGFLGAQAQFVIEDGGATRRPTLFFMAAEGAYLFVSGHPDMAPLAPPVADARPRLEALLQELFRWARTGDVEAAAPHLVYRGDGPDRWRRAIDPTVSAEHAVAEAMLRELSTYAGPTSAFEVKTYFSEAEAEGTWHVLEVTLGGNERTVFAFLLIEGVFVLGDID
ncbi:MAG: hypothetical protein AAGF99_18470 [Bacteroidota bacterium]